MARNETDVRRIMLAVTETSPIGELWQTVTQYSVDREAELITVFVCDDRWKRAASLPFTREISRVGGRSSDFTLTRAEQIHRDTITRTRSRLKELAAGSRIKFSFEIITEREPARIHEFVTSESDLLIVPSFLRQRPIYREITRLKCRILLVDTPEVKKPPDDTGET